MADSQHIDPVEHRLAERREHLQTLKAQADHKRTVPERIADHLVATFGSFAFIFLHVLWFGGWVPINIGWVPGIEPFDPFPFGLLTMVVSLEAIFLSILVLISQNRAQKIADLREEINLHVTTQSEHEITEILRIVDHLAQHLKVKVPNGRRVKLMEKDLNKENLKAKIEREIAND